MGDTPGIEIIARGLIRHGSRILVCRDRAGGYCYLPGGHVEFGESSDQALARELLEETSLTATIGPLLLAHESRFVQQGRERHELNLVFLVEHLGEQTAPSASDERPSEVVSREDHIEFVWIDLAALPDLVLYPDAVRAWLVSGGASTGKVSWLSIDERPDSTTTDSL